VDIAELDVLYRNLPSFQPEPASDSMVAEETRDTFSSTGPITFPIEPVDEMTAISLLATTDLRVITSPTFLTLVVEPAFSRVVTSPTSIVAGVLVSMKAPLRLPVIPCPSPTSTSTTSSTIMTVKLLEVLSSGTNRSPGVIEAEKEFVAEMVDSFYNRLKRSIALILKGSTTSFSALKVVLS